MEYNSTVNLPKTCFPMKANLLARQEEMLSRWQAQSIYHSILEDRRDARPFIIHDGPPYASGQLHVGIGMNKILKDIVAKYHSMNDRRVPFLPGWDCHGLPIEFEVRQGLGSRAKDTSISEIRERCAKHALDYVREQKKQFQLLGIFADWEKPYLTMTPSYEAGVLTVFLDMVEKRYVYRDRKPISWCPSCQTVLAEAEIEYRKVSTGTALPEGEETISTMHSDQKSSASLTSIEQNYPHCWRCATLLITRETEQWFVKLDHRETSDGMTLREKALLEVEIINWKPDSAKQRIHNMIETRPDWCISRQRLWGVPIPSFVCRNEDCGEAILSPEAIRKVRDLIGIHGSAVWFEKDAAEILPANFRCQACNGHSVDKGSDILDVGCESGTSWQSILVADHRLSFPADIYIEGNDQHRGWFQLSLLPALASRGKSPFQATLTHGFVLNEKMERMDRAKGDLITLRDALEKVPADIIRLYFAWV